MPPKYACPTCKLGKLKWKQLQDHWKTSGHPPVSQSEAGTGFKQGLNEAVRARIIARNPEVAAKQSNINVPSAPQKGSNVPTAAELQRMHQLGKSYRGATAKSVLDEAVRARIAARNPEIAAAQPKTAAQRAKLYAEQLNQRYSEAQLNVNVPTAAERSDNIRSAARLKGTPQQGQRDRGATADDAPAAAQTEAKRIYNHEHYLRVVEKCRHLKRHGDEIYAELSEAAARRRNLQAAMVERRILDSDNIVLGMQSGNTEEEEVGIYVSMSLERHPASENPLREACSRSRSPHPIVLSIKRGHEHLQEDGEQEVRSLLDDVRAKLLV